MAEVKPFKALRPATELISIVNSSPYDVISRGEAVEVIKRNPYSFLKVIKPEATVSPDKNMSYHKLALRAASNLQELIDRKVMVLESEPCLYIYQQSNGSYQRTGIVANLSVDDYQKGLIKKHEKIRLNTWQERVEHIRITRAHTGCALIIYKQNSYIERLIYKGMVAKNAIYDFISDDGVRNCCWKINQEDIILSLSNAFQKINSLYIADGHHRVSAAAEVMKIKKQEQNNTEKQDNEYAYFPAVLIPHHQIRILGYHRLVKGLDGFSPDFFLSKLKERFEIQRLTSNQPFLPFKKHEFGMNLAGYWYRLYAKENIIKECQSIVDKLDVSILQSFIFDSLLDINNSQKSKKLEFFGGKNAFSELENGMQKDAGIAFTLYPTSVDEVMKVSDNKEIMPPKSTWVEPKLRSGVFVHLF